jgi:dihydrofolate reductase
MAKVIYSMLTSLDGYIAGPEGGPGLPVPESELHWYFNARMREIAIELNGRRMYETMRVWDTWDKIPGAPLVELDFARAWQETPKVVFSTTLKEVGPNARLVKENVEGVVKSLKAETNGDISVSGATLAASLARLGLVDEYWLYVNPVVLGGGKPYFEAGMDLKLKLLGTESLTQDVVLLRYALAKPA